MELVKTTLRVDLGEAFNPWLQLRGMLREAAEKATAEIQGPPFVIDVPEKKQRTEFHIRALVLQQEGTRSIDEIVDIALTKVEKINRESKIPKISKLICESEFIKPYGLPFHEMLLMLKRKFLTKNRMTDQATDLGLIFDEYKEEILTHVQFGPMEKEQLLTTFLIWKRTDIPDNFIFFLNRYE